LWKIIVDKMDFFFYVLLKNTNNVIAGEVICALWDNWKIIPRIRLSDNGNRRMGLDNESSLKQKNLDEVNEKLLL